MKIIKFISSKELKWKLRVLKKLYIDYWLFHNYNLRPRGYYPTIKHFLAEQENGEQLYHEIYPATSTDLNIPEHYWEITSPYINKDRVGKESAKYILEIKNGRIHTDCFSTIAVFAENNNLIGEVSLDLRLEKGKDIGSSRILKRKYFENIHYLNGTVFPTIAAGGSYINYYHWLIDSISRIHLLKKSGMFHKVDWFYVPSIKYDYQIDSLKLLGIPEEKIVESTKHPHIKADLILAPAYTRGNHYHVLDWAINFIHDQFPPTDLNKFNNGKYYISRKDSSIRTISNEEEVIELLSQYGFKTIVLSKLPFQDKINLFASAEIIISGSGAGLTNLIFCREGTTIIEIFGDKFIDFIHYYALAAKRKLNYHYFLGKNSREINSMVEGQKDDVMIDIDKFDNLLSTELGLKSGI